MKTSKTFEYLIGYSIENFDLNTLRDIDVVRMYAGYSKMTEAEKMKTLLEAVIQHYRARQMEVNNIESFRIKIKRLVSAFKKLLGKRKLKSKLERKRQENFVENLHRNFKVTVIDQNLSDRYVLT